MKTLKIATTLAVTTLLFSACINKSQDTSQETPEQGSVQEISQNENADGSQSGSFADFLGMNKNQKCTWDGGQDGSSTLYTDGTRGKMEIVGQMDDKNTTSYMVNDGEWVYTWNSGSTTGMKMNPEEMDDEYMEDYEEDEMYEEMDDEDSHDLSNQEFKLNCEDWKVDASMFTPPANIEFTDLSAMMNNFKNDLQEGTPDMTAFCDMLSGEDKDECLEGMAEIEGL